jgi:uncharacterized protein DUF6931
MAPIRFVTVRDLYEAFPMAQDDVGAAASDEPSLPFLRSLVHKEAWAPAVSYCAYLLPRREAVWWGCQSLRRIQPVASAEDTRALDAAEAWVREPENDRRFAALAVGSESNYRAPATWMALAAGWSGGSVVPPEMGNAPAAPHQAARAIRAGLMIAMAKVPNSEMGKVLKPCLEEGMSLAVATRE